MIRTRGPVFAQTAPNLRTCAALKTGGFPVHGILARPLRARPRFRFPSSGSSDAASVSGTPYSENIIP